MRTIKILISGPHASGKSTLAQEILAKINADEIGALLNVDEVIVLSFAMGSGARRGARGFALPR